ncbi:hypothetical protein [Marinobacterium lacunae]|nr:hypothetical protein [Marinobacterium lacunae]MBR9884413.1 PilZ domain-containing protein [Oceanospirillales bacterium]
MPSPISYIQHPDNTPLSLDARPSSPPETPPLPLGLICNSLNKMPNGTLVEISSPRLAPDMRGIGQIIWCRRLGKGYQLGVAFYTSDDLYAIRMMEQLCHIEHYRHILVTEGQSLTLECAAREWIEKFAEHFPTDGL